MSREQWAFCAKEPDARFTGWLAYVLNYTETVCLSVASSAGVLQNAEHQPQKGERPIRCLLAVSFAHTAYS